MSYKETDWFSCMTTPIRIGVYKTQHRGHVQRGRLGLLSSFSQGRALGLVILPTVYLLSRQNAGAFTPAIPRMEGGVT